MRVLQGKTVMPHPTEAELLDNAARYSFRDRMDICRAAATPSSRGMLLIVSANFRTSLTSAFM